MTDTLLVIGAALSLAVVAVMAATEPVTEERAALYRQVHELGDDAGGVPFPPAPPALLLPSPIAPVGGEPTAPPEPDVPLTRAQLERLFGEQLTAAGMAEWEAEFYAQITQESSWRAEVCSPAGACGLTQFTPPTWGDWAPRVGCEGTPATDPECAIKAMLAYMGAFLERYEASNRADRLALSQAAYNGGRGWVDKEQAQCARRTGCDPSRWWGNVEEQCVRARWACDENRGYARRIQDLAAR